MESINSDTYIPSFQLEGRNEERFPKGTYGIYVNTGGQGPGAEQITAVCQNGPEPIYADPEELWPGAKQSTAARQYAAGVPCRYLLALLSVLCIALLGGLIALGVQNAQYSNRSDSLEKENTGVSVSESAVEEGPNNCSTENIQPVQSGMELRITGIPKPNPARFTIDIGHAFLMMALHFDIRFNYLENHRKIILNSYVNGSWGDRLLESNFPFVTGQEFQVTIFITSDNFLIDLPDGNRIIFPNRLGDKRYDFLSVGGDVKIQSISVE